MIEIAAGQKPGEDTCQSGVFLQLWAWNFATGYECTTTQHICLSSFLFPILVIVAHLTYLNNVYAQTTEGGNQFRPTSA